jgi:putative ABC transport system permease protein
MRILPTTLIALQALAKNKMRASLTVLGIVIGVAAVTTLVSIGEGVGQVVQGQFAGLGSNLIVVTSASTQDGPARRGPGGTPTLTIGDVEALQSQCRRSLKAVSPAVGVPAAAAIYHDYNWVPREMFGVTQDYLIVRGDWQLRLGSFFSDFDIKERATVCVIGQTVMDNLFQTTSPLGKDIRIQNIPFRVIGVLARKGTNILGGDQDDIVLAPHTTVRSRLRGLHSDKVDLIFCSAASPDSDRMSDATHEIRELLKQRHHVGTRDVPDFEVHNVAEAAKTVATIAGAISALLACIAGIALLVGGVGIMNIMLVSVTERTREIGIRMAVGADQRDILMQFLSEATVLSTLGGLVGLILGIAASLLIAVAINWYRPGTQWPMVVSIPAAVVAIVFAVGIGVFFGYYPARRASRMDPIDALRYE